MSSLRLPLRISTVLTILAIPCTASVAWSVPAFPGAEGFGAATAGGRDGQVLFVTSLADAGPGTLREAVETPGCRFVVFLIGGTIVLDTALEITNGCITIAGQTALGQGIELQNDRNGSIGFDFFPSLIVNAPDVVVRHVKIRPGIPEHDPQCTTTCPGPDPICNQPGPTPCTPIEEDALRIGQNDGLTTASNVILDHLSVSWANDEIISVMGGNDVTIQDSIVSEGINYVRYATTQTGKSGKGMMFGNATVASNGVDTTRISVLRNLFALNTIRNPQGTSFCLAQPPPGNEDQCATDIINNVSYGWSNMGILTANLLGHHYANQIGNVLRKGPVSHPADSIAFSMRDWTNFGFQYRSYVENNVRLEGIEPAPVVETPLDLSCFQNDGTGTMSVDCAQEGYLLAQPIGTPGNPAALAADAYHEVLDNAGARISRSEVDGSFQSGLDANDARVRADVEAQSGTIPGIAEVEGGTAPHQLWAGLGTAVPGPSVLMDTDADGMPDGWEVAHCLDEASASSWNDLDGDGYPDLEEYVNQTLPNDDDGDLVPNHLDNCPQVANPTQLDADATPDGYGNACDCDLTGDGECKQVDEQHFEICLRTGGSKSWCPAADMNDDGLFDGADQVLFDASFATGVPGPGAAACP